jgi:hypothetical protein
MRGLPQYDSYAKLNEKLFSFRLNVDRLNQELEKEIKALTSYDKTLK